MLLNCCLGQFKKKGEKEGEAEMPVNIYSCYLFILGILFWHSCWQKGIAYE